MGLRGHVLCRVLAMACLSAALVTVVGPAPIAAAGEDWVVRYDGTAHADDGAADIAVSPDGSRLFVTGDSIGSDGTADVVTMALDAGNGRRLWTRRYRGPNGRDDFPAALTVAPDGSRVYVTGTTVGASGSDSLTLAYDAATGTTRWTRAFAGIAGRNDEAVALAASPDGSAVVVTGWSESASGSDFITISYHAATGATRWSNRYGGTGGEDAAVDVGISASGHVLVTGSSDGAHTTDFATIAYHPDGRVAWRRRFSGPGGYDEPVALAISPDGARTFVSGISRGTGLFQDVATVAYDTAGGSRRWTSRYDGPAGRSDVAKTITVSPDGARVYLGVQSGSVTGSVADMSTVAHDAGSGAIAWTRIAPGAGTPMDIATSPDGRRVFLTGGMVGGVTSDYITLAYDRDGVPVGAAHLGGAGFDLAVGIAVGPDGRHVYVTGVNGASPGSAGGSDAATVAYGALLTGA